MQIKKIIFIFIFIFSSFALAKFDHQHLIWGEVLLKNTNRKDLQVNVQYEKLQKNDKQFKSYLNELEELDASEFKNFSSLEQLAFWINAYNAYTIKLVLQNYPIKSIKDISSGFFSHLLSRGPWDIKFIKLMGQKLSLNQIEHEIIRKNFNEPRIHFAVNCASISCPSLMQEPFTADKLDAQLDIAASVFLNDKTKNFTKNNILYLSKIFDWYGSDFKQKHGDFQKYIISNLQLPQIKYQVEFLEYNWGLNDDK